MSTFMLNALLAVANFLLHLSGHAWPTELAMQQAQCLLLALVPSISVTSIYGSYSVSLGDYKSQNFFQFVWGCGDDRGLLGRALASSTLRV